MAIFTAVNFLAVRLFARVNSTITWWKVAIPVLTIIILFTKFHSGNFSPGAGGFMPYGWKAVFAAIPTAGIVFSYLGFEQADQLAGRGQGPGAQPAARDHHRVPARHGDLHPAPDRLHRRDASGPAHQGVRGDHQHGHCHGPFAAVAALGGLGFWATILRIDAFVSPFGTGLIYQTSTSRVGYGLARNRYFPQIFQAVNSSGVPWFSLIMAFVFGLFFLLPFPSWQSLVGLVTSASVLMYAGAPLSLGAFRRKLPDAITALLGAGRRVLVAARLHHLPTC